MHTWTREAMVLAVFRLIRSLISLAALAALVWCAFRVPIGHRTFAEHADRISQTPEAREFVEETRESVTPVLQDAADRVLGEHVEAPTGAGRAAAKPANAGVVGVSSSAPLAPAQPSP